MKRFAIIILAVCAILAGCRKEDVVKPEVQEGTGSLSLRLKGGEDKFSDVNIASKASVDVNTFKINIDRKGGGYSEEWDSFTDLPALIELPSGEYTITASSYPDTDSKWGSPVYSGSQDFMVEIDRISNVEVVCSISNMKVSVRCSDKFIDELSDFEITVLSDGGGSLTWTRSDGISGQSGFFPVAPLDVRVKGYRAVNHQEATYSLHIGDVRAGSHYILNLDAITTGDSGFAITVDDTLNDTEVDIDVPGIDDGPVEDGEDGNQGGGEPDTPSDPETPAITMEWPANPDFSPVEIGAAAVDLKISVPAGIRTFVVQVSDNFKPAVSVITTGNVDYLDLINDESVIGALSGMDSSMPLGDRLRGMTSVDFSLTSLISLITMVGEPGAEYVFTLELTDANGTGFTKSLAFINPAN